MAYEDIGFIEKGKGSSYIKQDAIHINTRGGLLGCGHPIGATGIYQTNEIILQLQEKAPNGRQIKNCSRGLIHNMAAAGTSSTIIICRKMNLKETLFKKIEDGLFVGTFCKECKKYNWPPSIYCKECFK